MNKHIISADNFGDSYMLSYVPGCMGDFLASIILHSFKKKFFPVNCHDNVDSFNYEPWSKKWVVRDSTNSKLRQYLFKREQTHPFSDKINVNDFITEFKLNRTMFQTDKELASFLVSNVDSRKIPELPFFFVSETLSLYSKANAINQQLPGMTVIEACIVDARYKPLYVLLSSYKHKLAGYERNEFSNIDRKMFINYFATLSTVNPTSIESKMSGVKKFHKIDMMKLILDYDTQGLDILLIDDIEIRNMIDTARRDVNDILEFYGLELDNFPKFTVDKLNDLYDRLESLN
jgi:hypothetical protein